MKLALRDVTIHTNGTVYSLANVEYHKIEEFENDLKHSDFAKLTNIEGTEITLPTYEFKWMENKWAEGLKNGKN